MRLAGQLLGIALLVSGSGQVIAQQADNLQSPSPATLPDGWSLDGDRTVHAASDTRCRNDIAGFLHMRLSGPVDPNIVGTCRYEDMSGGGDAGIQVRRYMRGVGESREAIAYDRALIEPPDGEMPPMMTVRFAPATTRNGQMAGVVIMTKARNGLLIDCFAEGISLEDATKKIALFCAN